MLAQSATPDNLPLQQLMSTAQQWGLAQGMTAVQAQAMGAMVAGRQIAVSAAVMGFDDVFRVTAAITLLAIVPALFMKTTRQPAGRGQTIITD
jgi:sugar phosphate permease